MRAIAVTFVLFLFLVPPAIAQLRVGFYSKSCPQAEKIIRDAVAKRFRGDRSITAALLRMHFHDCFVRGCDASLLIDPRPGKPSEKNAGPNSSVRGFELIDDIKRQLEAKCRNTVSCADIIALATRDSVALAGGPSYSLPTGRRDGTVSNPNEVNLPGPSSTVSGSFQIFRSKGFSLADMVILSGAHSVGVIHCSLIQDRLADRSMDRSLASSLRRQCSAQGDPSVFLDQVTTSTVDNSFYKQLQRNRGVMTFDQNLQKDGSTRGLVGRFASNNDDFKRSFAAAMVKLGNTGVLTGRFGEIRRNCRVPNGGR